jgi:hypothetical protein
MVGVEGILLFFRTKIGVSMRWYESLEIDLHTLYLLAH